MTKHLHIQGNRFIDQYGREAHLRGVNLGGSSKMPPAEPSHIVNNFSRHRAVSFVGRPFPASEAHEHFARLQHWGFNTLRFLVLWEGIEHAGRGQYDTDYLDYLSEMIALAGEYGFTVFIDPHQDAWSRMTGGDGAPGWTLEAIGFDITQLDASEAAVTMQRRYPDYPTMSWTDNNARLACMTMFTLFLCGNRYAPDLKIEGLPVQEYLQEAFINAISEVAKRVKDMPHVIGYGPMNEPSRGFIGLNSLGDYVRRRQQMVLLNAQEAMFVGSGIPTTIETPQGSVVLNPHGISAWANDDLWQKLGIWKTDNNGQPIILKDDYFAGVDFVADALLPFTRRYAEAMRAIDPEAVIFLETDPKDPYSLRLEDNSLGAVVNASHWYDEHNLFTRRFDGKTALDLETQTLVHGHDEAAATFAKNIGRVVRVSKEQLGDVPTLIGEFGVSYDMNDGYALRTGDFSEAELALNMYYDALDANLAHSAQWNYTADNVNQWGDTWNNENLSIFGLDQRTHPTDIHSGGRAIRGFSRPFVPLSAGRLLERHFDWKNQVFHARITVEKIVDKPSFIHVPSIWYPAGFEVEVSSGRWEMTDNPQLIAWEITDEGEHSITIRPKH